MTFFIIVGFYWTAEAKPQTETEKPKKAGEKSAKKPRKAKKKKKESDSGMLILWFAF